MPVPRDHTICRFIRNRRQDWSEEEGRPKPKAFNQLGLSLWSANALNQAGDTLNDVRIAGFTGSGLALFTVDECHQLANDAAQETGKPLQINIDWQPNELPLHLANWAYAHAEVDLVHTSESALRTFRQFLAWRCRHIIRPHP